MKKFSDLFATVTDHLHKTFAEKEENKKILKTRDGSKHYGANNHSKGESKTRRLMAKKSRKINRKR